MNLGKESQELTDQRISKTANHWFEIIESLPDKNYRDYWEEEFDNLLIDIEQIKYFAKKYNISRRVDIFETSKIVLEEIKNKVNALEKHVETLDIYEELVFVYGKGSFEIYIDNIEDLEILKDILNQLQCKVISLNTKSFTKSSNFVQLTTEDTNEVEKIETRLHSLQKTQKKLAIRQKMLKQVATRIAEIVSSND